MGGRRTLGALAALLAACALAAGAAAARPTRLGKYSQSLSTAPKTGGIVAAAVNVGEGQDIYHYCDMWVLTGQQAARRLWKRPGAGAAAAAPARAASSLLERPRSGGMRRRMWKEVGMPEHAVSGARHIHPHTRRGLIGLGALA